MWGWGEPGANVSVQVVTGTADVAAEATTQVGDDGSWRVSLPPQPTSTAPVSIVATDLAAPAHEGGHVTLSDVLFGDVFVCSGYGPYQSSPIASFTHACTMA